MTSSVTSVRLSRYTLGLIFVGVALILIAPTLRFPLRWADPFDWRYFQAVEEVNRLTVGAYHQVPLWNPYMCGGEVALANPQSTVLAPTFLLTLLAGTPLGLKLKLFAYLLLALHGAYLLARQLKISQLGALLTGIAFGTCGWFALHLSEGHLTFAGAALFPYLLFFYLRAVEGNWLWSLAGGATLAWMAGQGGTYTLPMSGIVLGVMALADTVAERRPRPLFIAGAIGLGMLAFAAVRLLPALEFVRDHPRPMKERDANHISDFFAAFFAWQQRVVAVPGHRYRWHEYCCHISYLALGLALWSVVQGAITKVRRLAWLPMVLFIAWSGASLLLPVLDKSWARFIGYQDCYALLGVVAFWLLVRSSPLRRLTPLFLVVLGIAAGEAWPYGPWWLLRQLPVYHDLRVPSRYFILAALVLTVWAGYGFDRLLEWLARRERRVALWASLILALVAIEGLAFSTPPFGRIFDLNLRTPPSDQAFFQSRGSLNLMFAGVVENRGTLDCDEEAPLQRAGALEIGPGEQVRLLDPTAGQVALRSWSPNKLVIDADLSRESDILINLNWNEHWKCDDCQVLSLNDPAIERSAQLRGRATYRPPWQIVGQLAIRGPAGHRTFIVYYRPRSFVIGAWVSGISVILALAMVFLSLRRTRNARINASLGYTG